MFPNVNFSTSYGLPVPYQTSISPALSNGTQIHISGTPTGDRFEVNLKNHHDDIVLHFNPRLGDHTLVLNSAQRGSWGSEERHGSPFHRGVRFTLVILATDQGFKISVNNSHICEFRLRSPLHSAQLVEVKGDITLESAQVYPAPMGSAMNFPQMGGSMNFPAMNVSVNYPSAGANMPFVQPPFGGATNFNPGFGFPSAPAVISSHSYPMGGSAVPSIQSCRIHTGSRIFVRGFIPQGAKRFELNLLQGFSDGDDIAFHFNPRFDSNKIVKNHRQGGQWGHEDNQPFPPYMPLTPGSQIDLQIACLPDKYTVFMNNHFIAEFHHKITPGAVMALQYKGDITVTSVGLL